jgi:peptidyl-prolyl cis-trans isomerase A (cyclophilin A)
MPIKDNQITHCVNHIFVKDQQKSHSRWVQTKGKFMFYSKLSSFGVGLFFSAIFIVSCTPPSEATTLPPNQETKAPDSKTALKPVKSPKSPQASGKSLQPALITAEQLGQSLGLKKGDKLMATFETSMGNMTAELYWDLVPNTVANFVELAQGKRAWRDPKTGQTVTTPLYSGTIFHRVIPKFMIQGGDPQGTGRGGPGYRFADEFHPALKHNVPGVLSMANAGKNTNGSQFFITEVPTPHLDNRHSVFGKLVKGMDLVGKMARMPQNARNKPTQDIVLKKVSITPSKAKN